jgi:hypothetical protein
MEGLSGVYTSTTNEKINFTTTYLFGENNVVFLFEKVIPDFNNLNLDLGVNEFVLNVSFKEFLDFEKNVLNTQNQWSVKNINNELVVIPGTWSQKEVKGMYTSSSNISIPFETANVFGKMAIFLEGNSESLKKLNLRTGLNMGGHMFYVSVDEYNDFINNILRGDDNLPKNKNGNGYFLKINWPVINSNGEKVFIGGTWKQDMVWNDGAPLDGGARKKCKSYQRRSRRTGHCVGQKKSRSRSRSRRM